MWPYTIFFGYEVIEGSMTKCVQNFLRTGQLRANGEYRKVWEAPFTWSAAACNVTWSPHSPSLFYLCQRVQVWNSSK